MGTLTGQQIKDTYEGLLKLTDSTTGITNSFQAIQDGLGNDTGLQIKQDGFYSNNLSAGTYNDIFEYPGRFTPPTFSATTSADYGNTGTTGYFLASNSNIADLNPTGLSTASNSNVYPVPFWLYKGEQFRTISFWVKSADTMSVKVGFYEAVAKPNIWSVGIQGLMPGQLISELGEINCSTSGLKYLDFTTPYIVPYTGLYFVMFKMGQSTGALRIAGQGGFTAIPQARLGLTSGGATVWRVDNAPNYTINQTIPTEASYYTNRTYSDPFPTTFDYNVNKVGSYAQSFATGLHWVNQFQEI